MDKDLLQRLRVLERKVDQLYLPSPREALDQRKPLPFDKELMNVRAIANPDTAAVVRGRAIYKSPAHNTHGFTIQNCFVTIEVSRDTVPVDLGYQRLFTAVLEGSCGSPWVELDITQVISNGTPQKFVLPLLGEDSLSLATRFVLYCANNAENEPIEHRRLDLRIVGMLVSGAGF